MIAPSLIITFIVLCHNTSRTYGTLTGTGTKIEYAFHQTFFPRAIKRLGTRLRSRRTRVCIWATRKYSISVDIVEKIMIHERRKCCILLATPINTTHHVLSAHAHNLVQYVGKGRQQNYRPGGSDAAVRGTLYAYNIICACSSYDTWLSQSCNIIMIAPTSLDPYPPWRWGLGTRLIKCCTYRKKLEADAGYKHKAQCHTSYNYGIPTGTALWINRVIVILHVHVAIGTK